jgi:cell division protein FtsB
MPPAPVQISADWALVGVTCLGLLGSLALTFWNTARWSQSVDALKEDIEKFGDALEKLSNLTEGTSREVAELRGRLNELRAGGRR